MKEITYVFIAILAALMLTSCPEPDSGSNTGDENGSLEIGYVEELTVGSETLKMIYVNSSTSITFPTIGDDSGSSILTTKIFMGETEVTNAVMAAVYQWAYDNGRFSSTFGDHNGLDSTAAKHGGQQLFNLDDSNCRVEYNGSGSFLVESGYENNPVTNVTWYGAVLFCNWLTEMRDGNSNNIVYTTIDNSWVDDETTEDVTKTGYRLPSSDEWEYAARYRGNDTTNTVSGYTSPYYTKGNSASGATAYNGDTASTQAVAVYDYTDPNPYSDEQEVKSLGLSSANSLGLYDMSGNVWEWCFNETANYRVKRGGSWNWNEDYLRVSLESNEYPYSDFEYLGFRLCRTAN